MKALQRGHASAVRRATATRQRVPGGGCPGIGGDTLLYYEREGR
jgi:hypothetical protein